MTGFEITMTTLTAIYVAATIFYAVTSHKTLAAIQKQIAEMEATREQTVEQMKASADAARISADAAKKASDIAEQALRISERADLLLDQVGFNTGMQPLTGDSRVMLTYKNHGRTRAKNVRFAIKLIVPTVPNYPAEELTPVAVGANDTQSVSFHSFRQWVTQETFQKIASGELEMRFEAHASYEDVFNLTHTSINTGLFYPKTRTFIMEKSESD